MGGAPGKPGGRGWGAAGDRRGEKGEKREKREEREGGSPAAGRLGLGTVVGGRMWVAAGERRRERERGREREEKRKTGRERKSPAAGGRPAGAGVGGGGAGGGSPASVTGGGTHPFFSHSLCYNMTVPMVFYVHPQIYIIGFKISGSKNDSMGRDSQCVSTTATPLI
ncbi:hypothetical protein TIFTF001_000207 [Ficus carica]|uniref:Uncharacterized protein n=1 Tax=Ficus carica TaxID=3494 RepID=A0AA87Z3S4_FICCA|nr:hypothetical protein TIFTF001_000207 [Ficus carica]